MFTVGIIMARLIMPTAFGHFGYMFALVEGLTLITGFGIITSIIQNQLYPEYEFQNVGFFFAVVVISVYLIVAIAVGLFSAIENVHLYFIMLLAKSFNMLSGVHGVSLQKEYKFKIDSIIRLFALVISSTIGIVLAIKGYGLKALVVNYAVLQVFTGIFILHYSSFKITYRDMFNKKYVKVFLNNGKILFVSQAVEKLLISLDKILINLWLGAANLAFFNRAINIGHSLQAPFTGIFGQLFHVSFADLQQDKKRLGLLFQTSVWMIFRISVFITLIIVISANELILILYGENWQFAASIIPLLSIFFILFPIKNISRGFFLSNGYFEKLRNIQILELIFFLIFMAIGMHYGGIEGICVGISVWMLIFVFVYMVNVSRFITLEWARLFLLPTIAFITILALNYVMRQYSVITYRNIYDLAFKEMVFVTVVYASIIFLFESREIRILFERIKKA